MDLRDHARSALIVDDMEGFRLATGIVDPDPGRRRTERSKLPASVSGLDDGDVFEFIVALACAVTTEPDAPRGIMRRMKTISDFARITPSALATAGRALIDWPRTFHTLADGARSASHLRPGHFGIRKELGPFLMLGRDPHLSETARAIVRRELDANMAANAGIARVRRVDNHRDDGWITLQEASRRFDIHRRMMARLATHPDMETRSVTGALLSPKLVALASIRDIAAERNGAVSSVRVAARLGVTRAALPDLARRGLLRRIVGPVTSILVGDDYYARAELDRLVAGVRERAGDSTKPSEISIRLSKAAKRLGGDPPWGAILEAILTGEVAVHAVAGENQCLATSVGVTGMADLVRSAIAAGVEPLSGSPGDSRISHKEAAKELGTTEAIVAGLVGSGLLHRTPDRSLGLLRKDVATFRRTYVLVNEIAMRMNVRNRDVRKILTARGLPPHASARLASGYLWRRSDVERALSPT